MPDILSSLPVKRAGAARHSGPGAALVGLLACMGSTIGEAAETKAAAGNTPLCRSLGIFNQSSQTTHTQNPNIKPVLEKLEKSFLNDNADLFANIASDSLQKKRDELKGIFNSVVLEYGLKRAQLQRSSLWEITFEGDPQPGQVAVCGDVGIQPVFGPREQFAALYSIFSANQQTRMLVIFARTPQDAQKDGGVGIVLLQVQRWTYNGRSPETLLAESQRNDAGGEPIIAQLLSEAAARVLESNPYMIFPLQQQAREQAQRLGEKSRPLHAIALRSVQTEQAWKPERFAAIFRDGELAVGVKVRMIQEIALNDQLKKCDALGKKLFTSDSAWRRAFSGFECLTYGANEDISSFPKGGSQYIPWKVLDSKK